MSAPRTCEVCGKSLVGRRANATTCGDACRAKKSRRNRDPQIGTAERRRRQRDGLDKRFTYRQRAQMRRELQLLGLIPSHWVKGADRKWSPQFETLARHQWWQGAWPWFKSAQANELARRLGHPVAPEDIEREFQLLEQKHREADPASNLWQTEDGWEDEWLLATSYRRHGRTHSALTRRRYRRAVPAASIDSGIVFDPVYELIERRHELQKQYGPAWAKSEKTPRHRGAVIVESDIGALERSRKFTCRHCGAAVWTKFVLEHVCEPVPASVTPHNKGAVARLPPRQRNEPKEEEGNADRPGEVPARRRYAA